MERILFSDETSDKAIINKKDNLKLVFLIMEDKAIECINKHF